MHRQNKHLLITNQTNIIEKYKIVITNVIRDYDEVRNFLEPFPWREEYIEDVSLYGDGITLVVKERNLAVAERTLKGNHFTYYFK